MIPLVEANNPLISAILWDFFQLPVGSGNFATIFTYLGSLESLQTETVEFKAQRLMIQLAPPYKTRSELRTYSL